MKIVRIPYTYQAKAAMFAIELSNWCKENNLEHGYDYDWALSTHEKEIHFRFYNDAESLATMLTLKWAGYEI